MEVTAAREARDAANLDSSPNAAPLRAEREQSLLAAENKLAALRSGKMADLQKYAAGDPAILQSAMRRQSSALLNREQENKIRIEQLKGEIALSDLVFDNRKQELEFARQEAQLKLDVQKRTPGFLGGEPEALAAVKAAEEKLVKFLEPINKALDLLPIEREEAVANIALKLGKVASINLAKEDLSLLASRGAVTQQQAAQQLQTLTNQQAQLDLVQKLKEIEKTRFLAQLEYSRKVLESGEEESTEMLAQYKMIQSRAQLKETSKQN